jgi:ATP-binding cassette subfamily C (CFTR/MRP) protein 1
MAFSVPILASTLAFVVYTETSKAFDVAIVFASFSLFQVRHRFRIHVSPINH